MTNFEAPTAPLIRAYAYCRISLDSTGEALGVQRQLEACEKYITLRGWSFEGSYIDNSVSATNGKRRPEYERMLEDVHSGQVQAITVVRMDRLLRRPVELETFIELNESLGLILATTDGELDLSTSAGRVVARILASLARQEVEVKSARQKSGHDQRAQRGLPWATRRPFGFEANAVDHHPIEAGILKDAYRRLLIGESQSEIARHLTSIITTTVGNAWTQSTVRMVLMKPRNAGLLAHNGVVVGPGVWEPIVSEETWRLAVARMTSGRQPGGGAIKHLLIGAAYCGVCGGPARTAYTSKGVRLYSCGDFQHVGRHAEKVEAYVENAAVERLARGETVALTDRRTSEGSDLVQRSTVLRGRLDGLAVSFADGDLTAGQVRTASARLLEQLAENEKQLLLSEGNSVLIPLIAAVNVETSWDKLSVSAKRRAIIALMDVVIQPTGRGNRFNPENIELDWTKGRRA